MHKKESLNLTLVFAKEHRNRTDGVYEYDECVSFYFSAQDKENEMKCGGEPEVVGQLMHGPFRAILMETLLTVLLQEHGMVSCMWLLGLGRQGRAGITCCMDAPLQKKTTVYVA